MVYRPLVYEANRVNYYIKYSTAKRTRDSEVYRKLRDGKFRPVVFTEHFFSSRAWSTRDYHKYTSFRYHKVCKKEWFSGANRFQFRDKSRSFMKEMAIMLIDLMIEDIIVCRNKLKFPVVVKKLTSVHSLGVFTHNEKTFLSLRREGGIFLRNKSYIKVVSYKNTRELIKSQKQKGVKYGGLHI